MKNKKAKSIFSSLENYSSIPPPELWEKIEAQLDQPKKKKSAILWWSVAASLVVGLSVPTILYFNSNQTNELELSIGNKTDDVVLQNDSNSNSINNERSVVNADNDGDNFNRRIQEKEDDNVKLNNKYINLKNVNQVTIKTVPTIFSKTKEYKSYKNSNEQNNGLNNSFVKEDSKSDAIVANQKAIHSNTNNGSSDSSKDNSISSLKSDKEIAVNEMSKSESVIDKSAQVHRSNINKESFENSKNISLSASNTNRAIATNEASKPELAIERSVPARYSNTDSKVVVSDKNVGISTSNRNKTIAEYASSKDSLNNIKLEVAQLEKALAQQEKDKTKKKEVSEIIDKWSLQVFAGVMSSQNYNNEKALGNTVTSKQSSGYGVKTNYKLNKKWAVSSGFKINELGQKINDVAYYERGSMLNSTSGILPNNIHQDSPSQNSTIVFVSDNENYLFASNSKTSTGFETGNVTQNLKYFEMPLEVSYALLSKKKTSISMNTGGFVGKLISNDVFLNGSSIGENENVNEYVYGTLLSSTLQYEIFKKTKFFVEPGMNYYINPLENQSFNQFQWMFNIGVNVSF